MKRAKYRSDEQKTSQRNCQWKAEMNMIRNLAEEYLIADTNSNRYRNFAYWIRIKFNQNIELVRKKGCANASPDGYLEPKWLR